MRVKKDYEKRIRENPREKDGEKERTAGIKFNIESIAFL